MRSIHVAAVVLLGLVALAAPALAAVFVDGFESYNVGALDKNYASGTNTAPNGSGQPWFGPAPPNAQVVTSDNGVLPHSGNQMIRGAFVTGSDRDENWVNLAYRFNGGAAYAGNISLDWWFYDPLGPGGTTFQDYGAIGYYNTAPTTTDYPGTGSLNSATQIQRLGLGAPYLAGTAGYDSNVYQARVVGAADGYGNSAYFNTATPRTIGWHHAHIDVGAALADNSNLVSFYIDDLTNPTLSHNSVTKWGYNVIEFNTKYGTTTGYFDDITFDVTPEPTTGLLALLALSALRRR